MPGGALELEPIALKTQRLQQSLFQRFSGHAFH